MSFSFEGKAKRIMSPAMGGENIAVWTGNVLLQTMIVPGEPCPFKLEKGKKYRVTIEEAE